MVDINGWITIYRFVLHFYSRVLKKRDDKPKIQTLPLGTLNICEILGKVRQIQIGCTYEFSYEIEKILKVRGIKLLEIRLLARILPILKNIFAEASFRLNSTQFRYFRPRCT